MTEMILNIKRQKCRKIPINGKEHVMMFEGLQNVPRYIKYNKY